MYDPDGDGDDDEVWRFRNSSGGAELGVDVRGLLVLVLGVAEVEEVEVDALLSTICNSNSCNNNN